MHVVLGVPSYGDKPVITALHRQFGGPIKQIAFDPLARCHLVAVETYDEAVRGELLL